MKRNSGKNDFDFTLFRERNGVERNLLVCKEPLYRAKARGAGRQDLQQNTLTLSFDLDLGKEIAEKL